MARRSMVLGFGLVLTLIATWYAAGVDDTDDELLASPQRAAPPAGSATPARVQRAVAAPADEAGAPADEAGAPPTSAGPRMTREGGDLFAVQSWQPPPPPPSVAAPAPAPRAPALPYRYLGRMEEDGRVVAFLSEGAQLPPRVVRQGDLLPNHRVDEINSAGMRLTYLPLNETQRLLFGSTP